jgi:hypothetical protein
MDVGLFNLDGDVKQVTFGWDGTGLQIVCRLSATTWVGLNITSASISYIQSQDNGTTWTTVWTK